MSIIANTTLRRYIPRHAANAPRPSLALARGFRAAIQGLRSAQSRFARRLTPYEPRHLASPVPVRERLRIILRRIDRKLDEDMTTGAKLLCASLAGLVFGPLLFFCYFS